MRQNEIDLLLQQFFQQFRDELSTRAPELEGRVRTPRTYSSSDASVWILTDVSGVKYQVGFEESKKKFRVNLSFDTDDEERNRAMLARLREEEEDIEAHLGLDPEVELAWENPVLTGPQRHQHRYARLVAYRCGSIRDSSNDELRALQEWAVETLPRFYEVLQPRLTELCTSSSA